MRCWLLVYPIDVRRLPAGPCFAFGVAAFLVLLRLNFEAFISIESTAGSGLRVFLLIDTMLTGSAAKVRFPFLRVVILRSFRMLSIPLFQTDDG